MINIILNGQPQDCRADLTITELLQAHGLDAKPVAVEVNREIVPRSQHATHTLSADDRVEIVHAIGGG